MRKKFMSFALALTMIASLVPTNGVEAAKAKKPALSQSKLSLEVGSKKTLTLKKAPKLSKKKIKKVKWSSSNSKVVSVLRVNKNKTSATLKGLARGSAIVKVKYNGKTYKCKVTVMETSSTRRNTEVVTEKLTEQEKTTEKSTQKDTEQEKTTEKPSNDTAKPSEEKPTTHVHSYGNWKTVVAATCVKDGSEKRECSCGDKEVRTIKALGHQWDSGKVTKAATYKEAGVKTYTCAACSETKTESIPMLTETEHAWDNGVATKAATCAEMGVKTYTCKNCGGTKTENIPAKTEHTWNAGITTKAATYTESGIKTYICTVCGTTKTEAIPMLTETEHKWNTGKITAQPTCTKTGIKTYTCENCGGTKTEILPVLEHSYSDGIITKAATCTSAGIRTYTCKVCGSTKTEDVPATGTHSWDSGKVTKAATCTKDGSKVYTCKICGDQKSEVIKSTGHSWDAGVIAEYPTLEANGTKVHTCTKCQIKVGETMSKVDASQAKDVSAERNGGVLLYTFSNANGYQDCFVETVKEGSTFYGTEVFTNNVVLFGGVILTRIMNSVTFVNTVKLRKDSSNLLMNATYLTKVDMRKADVSSVTDARYMFAYTPKLTSILVSSDWKFESNCKTDNMFTGSACSSVTYK